MCLRPDGVYTAQHPCSGRHLSNVAYEEVRRCDIRPFIEAGLLQVVEPETEEEAINVIAFAADLGGDGEAYTGAIAIRRRWTIVSDERRVLNYFEPPVRRLR